MRARLLLRAIGCVALMVSVARAQQVETFTNPMMNGRHVDRCLHWGTECGQPAADEFCRSKGFARADYFEQGRVRPTVVIGDNKVCDDEGCDGLTAVRCVGRAGVAAAEAPLLAGTGPGSRSPQPAATAAPVGGDLERRIVDKCQALYSTVGLLLLVNESLDAQNVAYYFERSRVGRICFQYLSPSGEARRKTIAWCDELFATAGLVLVLADNEENPIHAIASLQDFPLARYCANAGWSVEGFRARNPQLVAEAPSAPPPSKDGKPWSWSGSGLCRRDYAGHTRKGVTYAPSPPYEAHAELFARWIPSLNMYEVRTGCGKVFGRDRTFSFDDRCDQSASDAPVEGCYYKCRDNYRLSNGRVTLDVDRATFDADFEDDASGSWGSFKGHTTCTFLNRQ